MQEFFRLVRTRIAASLSAFMGLESLAEVIRDTRINALVFAEQ